MKIVYVSIFPDIFHSFVENSLIKKAQEKWILSFEFVDPRSFCLDKHKQVDDQVYGGGAGMLLKAEPMIQAIESILNFGNFLSKMKSWKIVYLSPSQKIFDQKMAHEMSEIDAIIFVCGRYEWVDYRFVEYMKDTYPNNFDVVSVGSFVTLWWEIPAMLMTEAVVRLIPWVIKEEISWQDESYALEKNMQNIEYPQYTRPEEVRGMSVPAVLLSGHHKNIEKWKAENEGR